MNLSQQFSSVTLTVIQHLTKHGHQLDLEKYYRQIPMFYRVTTINRANCKQTGTYMCQATNTFNGEMGMANKTIDLYVLCKLVNKAK